jgi:hypothetical protein
MPSSSGFLRFEKYVSIYSIGIDPVQFSPYSNGLRLGDWGSILGRNKRFFSTPQRPDRLWVPTTRLPAAVSLWVKRPGRETDLLPSEGIMSSSPIR